MRGHTAAARAADCAGGDAGDKNGISNLEPLNAGTDGINDANTLLREQPLGPRDLALALTRT